MKKTNCFFLALLLLPFALFSSNGFVPNQGQIVDDEGKLRPEVHFVYEMPGAKLFFHNDKIIFAFWKLEYVENEKSRELLENGDIEGAKFHSMRIHQMRIDLEFTGSDPNTKIVFDDRMSHYINFFHGHCPEGVGNVYPFRKVTYQNLYNNIDLVFYASESGLKYDVVLRPGARLSDVRFTYKGITELELNDGFLNVKNVFTPLVEQIPHSYFLHDQKEVKVEFDIINNNTFGFKTDAVANDIIEHTLVIDPALTWSTYFENTVTGIVSTIRGNNITDADGNFFYQINTYTANLPLGNPGAPAFYDPSYNPSSGLDIYFAKFNVNRQLIWSTYLGGTSGNQSNYYDHALATWNGFFFICGNTNSNNFPLVNQGGGAYYQTYPGSTCGFLSKFNATTGQMIHSTYLRSYDYHCMDVDNQGNIAVVSFNYTWSVTPNVMSRTGAYNQATHGGDSDLFIYMFNSSLQQTWGTYFGGPGYTDIMGVTFDNNRNLFVYSRSSSNNAAMPLLNPGGGAFYQSTITDKYDCGISKFNTSGALVWSTYYGGAGLEGLSYSKAKVNDNNDIILTTTTRSTVMPVFNQGGGAYYQGTPPVGLNNGWGGDPGCGFYIRFNNNGVRQHATYIGVNNESNYIHDQAQGNCQRQYIILSTMAFPTTSLAGSYNQTNGMPAQYNYMAIEFNENFAIRWASYLQRDSSFFEQFAIDRQRGRLYVTGLTRATDYITANPGGGAYFDGVKDLATATQYVGAIMDFDIGAPPNVWVSGGGNPEVCYGASITLNASGSGTINWYTLQTGGTLLGTGTSYTLNNVTSNTTIWVESVDGGCPSARVPITVTVLPSPSISLSASPTTICQGASVTINASGGTSYSWSHSLGTGSSKSVSPASTTTYVVTGTGSNGCTNTANITITVNPNPTVSVSPSAPTICAGSSATITASGAGSYSWSHSLGANSSQVVSPGSTTTYTVTGTTSGCTGTASVTVTVNPNPTVSVSPSAPTICAGSSTTITASGAGSYSWSHSLGTGSSKVVSPASTTTYTVTGTTSGCTGTTSVTVTVNPNPTVSVSPSASTICEGSSTTISASGATSYSWSHSLGTNFSQVVSPGSTTTYTVTGTTSGCTGTASVTVTVNPNPIVSVSPFAPTICAGSSATITASGAGSYSWSHSLGTGSSKVVNPASTTTYTVTGTTSGCTGTTSVTVTVNPNPTVSVSPSAPSICAGSSTTITASGASSYSWSHSLGAGSSHNVSPGSTTTYTVTGTSSGCTGTSSVTVTVNPNPVITFTPSAPVICQGNSVTIGADGATTYNWSHSLGSGSSKLVSPSSTTTYTVTGTLGSCTGSANITVTVNSNPTVSVSPASPSICAGGSTNITASGATSYSWSHSMGSNASQNVSPGATTTYFVTGTSSGCTGTTSVTVTVNSNPTVGVSPPAPAICGGASVNINATGADSYSWSHSLGAGASQTVSPSTTTTYSVTGTSLGCTGSASVTVSVLASPTVVISPSATTVCSGQQITLGASGASNYNWSTSQTSSIITPSPASTTTYTVTGTDGNGCTGSSSVLINVHSLPSVNITPSATVVCQGQQITLTASGAVSYSWSPSGSGSVINPTPPVSMTYYVTGTDVNNCQGVDSVQVVVNPLPSVTLNASTTSICSGEQVTLTAGGASSYNWTPSGSGSVNVVNPTTTTTYSVVGTDANLCTASATVTVNVASQFDATISPVADVCSNSPSFNLTAVDGGGVWSGPGITNTSTGAFNPSIAGAGTHQISYTIYGACGDSDNINIVVVQAPNVQLSSTSSSICNGQDVILTASGAVSYSWSPSGSGSSNTVSPSTTTTYFVTGTSGSCQNTASFTVTVHQLPLVSLLASDSDICTGEQSSLTASGANTYQWSNAGSGNPINVSPIVTTTYTVTGTDGNGCSNTANLTIIVHDTPVVALNASATSVCVGDTVVIIAGGADTYLWSPSGSGTGGEFFPTATTTYSVTGTSANGCSATASVTVNVMSPQNAEILSSGPYCSADDPIVLNAVDGGGVWSGAGITNAASGIFNPSVAGPGVHTITYTIAGNCGDSDSRDFIVYESPAIVFVPTPITCDGAADGVLDLNISGGSQPYSIHWSNGSNNQILTDLSPGSYSVVVIDDNGCSVTSGFNIDDPGIPCDAYQPHVVVPNIFSPNGDGQNDILYVRGEGIVSLEFIVYSRWGEKIFETRNKDIGWDGTYQGSSLDPAVFVYYLKATMINFEEIILQGDITLIK